MQVVALLCAQEHRRGRETETERQRQRQRERKRILSRFLAVRVEPNMGLKPKL